MGSRRLAALSKGTEMFEKLLEWDRATFIYLNNLGVENYDTFWTTVTNFPTWIPLFILFIVLIFLKYPKREAFFILLTIIFLIVFISVATDVTKDYFERLRPNNDSGVNTLIRILKTPITYSFFSGHAASSFSITTVMVLFLRRRFKWSWLFYIWPILFASSRIFVGVHYPLDIIVGALVGILTAIAFYKMYTNLIVPYKKLNHP